MPRSRSSSFAALEPEPWPRVTPDEWSVPRLEQALDDVEDPGDAVSLRVRLAHALRFRDPALAVAHAEAAVRTTEPGGARRLDALRALTAALTSADQVARADDLAATLVHEAALVGSTEHLAHGLLVRRYVARTLGRTCAARHLEVRLRDVAAREPSPLTDAIVRQIDVGRSLVRGELAAARAGVARMLDSAQRADNDLVIQSAIATALLCDWLLGAASPAWELAADLADRQSAMPAWHAAVLIVLALPPDQLGPELASSVGRDLDDLPRHALWLAQLVMYAELARRCGDAHRGRALAAALEPVADLRAMLGDVVELGSAWLGVGAGADAAGDLDRALDAYGRAADANRDAGAVVWELLAEVRVADVRARLGRPLPASDLRQLLARVDELGAAPLLEEAAGLRDVADHPLSPREVEVARVVATGASNVDIAAQLFISVKTVERHLANIFTKLGLASRVELAAWAFGTGVADAGSRWVNA